MHGYPRVDILGCPFDAVTVAEIEQAMEDAIGRRVQLHITTGNVDMVMKMLRDPLLARAFWKSQLAIVDGVPILWAAAFLRRPVKGRIRGIDLVWLCAAISQKMQCGVALMGSEQGIVERAAKSLKRAYPGCILNVIPTPFPLRPEDSEPLIKLIRVNDNRILLLGLGAPRQELWLQRHLAATGADVGIGIGGAFDVSSGSKPQAPRWMQSHGLEWLHRMRLEPRRLSRRYLVEDLPFFAVLLKERMQILLRELMQTAARGTIGRS